MALARFHLNDFVCKNVQLIYYIQFLNIPRLDNDCLRLGGGIRFQTVLGTEDETSLCQVPFLSVLLSMP